MAVDQGASSKLPGLLVSLGKNESTKTLLKVIILAIIAAAAVASRLFSVIRMSMLFADMSVNQQSLELD